MIGIGIRIGLIKTSNPVLVVVATSATEVSETSFTANWNPYSGAQYYLLDVSTSSSFSSFILQNQVVSTNSYLVTGLTANTTYYYRVRASTDAALLLDLYPNAAAAYSLRKLRASYSGSAIRVRRSSDNTEQNIGFTLTGDLDTSALTTFCSGTNGFVTTWYDQSGNSNNATQTTAANQPQIVSSGSIINVNSKPCLQFTNSSTQNLNLANSIWTYTGNCTAFNTVRNRNNGGFEYGAVISQGGGTLNQGLGFVWQQYPNTETKCTIDIFSPGGTSTTANQTINTQYLSSIQWQNWSTQKTNGNTIIAINGVNQSIAGFGSTATGLLTTPVKIGQFDNTPGGSFLGDIQEIVIYTSVLSQTNIDGAESNINSYYGIY
jgi:hypothetical protein